MSAARKFVPSYTGGKARFRGMKMTEFIGKATDDGQLMASFFVRVLKGIEKSVNVGHKIKAAEWLADRYAGKAVDIALSGDIDSPNNPLAELDADQLKQLILKIAPRKQAAKPRDALAPPETPTAHLDPQITSADIDPHQPTADDKGAYAHPRVNGQVRQDTAEDTDPPEPPEP